MIVRDRHNRILKALQESGAASVKGLADTLSVSEATIRRDLHALDRNGELVRTYGGALLRPGQTVGGGVADGVEGPFQDGVDTPKKQAVAAAAAAMVDDGDVVVLDIGTTTPHLARLLKGRDVTVITSNIAVFDELRDDDAVRLVLLGGVMRRNYRTLVGSLTEQALSQVSADKVFLTCTGVRSNGHVLDDMEVEAPLKKLMIASAARTILLATDVKFPGTGALRLCSLSDVDVVVTTPGAPEQTLDLCRDAGGEVVFA